MKEGLTEYRITDLQLSERPRERLEKQGASALSQAELLAILIRVGVKGENALEVAQRILERFRGLRGLQSASFLEISRERGIGKAKAAQIQAAIELGNRLSRERPIERVIINSPEEAANLIRYEMSGLDHEEIWTMLLDTRNKLIEIKHIYVGSLNSAFARTAEIFKPAILANAAGIILAHNHPSGESNPSPEDIAMTRNLVQAGRMLDIDLVDHLVIAANEFTSLKERHLGFD
ncbi:MAG: DNA repair protein RadC [Anaerolineaceae bacterium]|nr:DNA repair protein RadC [Anaerolineaceae bacterium]